MRNVWTGVVLPTLILACLWAILFIIPLVYGRTP